MHDSLGFERSADMIGPSNVRSTQLAFQHNQRTLEAGLRMADTLREGIQSLAETQADWIKSLVASRGFFRNGAMPQIAALLRGDVRDTAVSRRSRVARTGVRWLAT